MMILVLAVMAQLICCGGLIPVHDWPVPEQGAWSTPARWALARAASSTDLMTLRSDTCVSSAAEYEQAMCTMTVCPCGRTGRG